jgi:hypothetical protein
MEESKMKTFQEFILECYDISEGSEIAGRLADLAQKKANNLFQGNRQWDPNRAKIQTLTRIADLAGARSSDKPEPKYPGMTLPPPGGGGKSANLPPRKPINSRGGSGDSWSYERDRGNKDQRLLDFVSGRRDSPNMSTREREERDRSRGRSPARPSAAPAAPKPLPKPAAPKPQVKSPTRRGGGSTSRSGNAGTSSGNISPRSASERSGLPRSFRPGAAGSGPMIDLANSYEPDLYDTILLYLLDEGYTSTEEEAIAIMESMSEKWKESIIEDLGEVRSRLMKRQKENASSFTKRIKPKTSFRERLKQKALQKKLESL